MKLSNIQMVNAINVLKDIREKECQMPINLAFLFIKNAAILENELSAYQKAYSLLLDKYSVKNEDGTIVVNKDNSVALTDNEAFIKEYTDLASAAADVKIELIDIELCKNLNITLDKMIHIQFMFSNKKTKGEDIYDN